VPEATVQSRSALQLHAGVAAVVAHDPIRVLRAPGTVSELQDAYQRAKHSMMNDKMVAALDATLCMSSAVWLQHYMNSIVTNWLNSIPPRSIIGSPQTCLICAAESKCTESSQRVFQRAKLLLSRSKMCNTRVIQT
jgi:hypothetical protein